MVITQQTMGSDLLATQIQVTALLYIYLVNFLHVYYVLYLLSSCIMSVMCF